MDVMLRGVPPVMQRRLARLAVIASTAMAVALGALWVRGFFVRDRIALPFVGRYYVISNFPDHLYIDSDPAWNGARDSAEFGLHQYPVVARYLEVRLVPRAGGWSLGLPIWLPLLFALALPGWACGRLLRRRLRYAEGLCPQCGYDLRASPERCPECGRVVVGEVE